jgi:hypothetical protein
MFDDVTASLLAPGGTCYAYYVDGHYANISAVAAYARAHHARTLGIAVFASDNAEALDCEPGDATPDQAAGWVKRQRARGVARPVVYASASVMGSILGKLKAAGIGRADVRLWTAHYGAGKHVCGPHSCGLLGVNADGTQWTDHSNGRSLDESVLDDNFFGAPDPFPVLLLGDTGAAVRTLQTRLDVWGAKLVIDGAFGGNTDIALRVFQRARGMVVDGIAGKATWGELNATPLPPVKPPVKPPAPDSGVPHTAPFPVSVSNKDDFVTWAYPPVGGATRYELRVTGTAGSKIGDWVSGITRVVAGVHGHKTFRWQMRAGNAHGFGPWGAVHVYSLH